MLITLYKIIQGIQPLLVPICFLFTWLFLLSLVLTLYNTLRETNAIAKQMHQIPCTNCQFFTNDYRLKCTIQPRAANTEQAIDCSDYRSQ
nr:hypothetical protein [Gloeocapsa sp. PCC 73106]